MALSAPQRDAKTNLTFRIITWGCQMNVEDSEQLELQLQSIGLSPAGPTDPADVVLLNTCSVRAKPEDKAFSMLGVLAKEKALHKDMVIGVCGCMAQLRAKEIRRRAPHVDFVVGTAELGAVPGLVAEARQRRRFQMRTDLPDRKGFVVTQVPSRLVSQRTSKLKAFVPIQYGCDKFCTFCIVPTTRGRERSRPTEELLAEIQLLATAGTKEVTLLGQTVNSYGKNMLEGKVPFARLLRQIAEIPGIERIRYVSPYPRDFRDDLISAHTDCRQVVEHCHLPLQSGDNEVLTRMKRIYSVASFTEIYEKLRAVPGMAVTTDIIVGFPGETEEQFAGTMKVMETLRFDCAFMFAYSPRPGTPAGDWDDQVPMNVKKRRLNELIALQGEITNQIHESQVGEVFEVMVEGVSEKQPGLLKGLSRQFKTMHFVGPALPGDLVRVRATEPHPWGFFGEIVPG